MVVQSAVRGKGEDSELSKLWKKTIKTYFDPASSSRVAIVASNFLLVDRLHERSP